MSDRPAEVTELHTRLMKCALEVEDARAYWQHADLGRGPATARRAFDEYWFGARSLARIEVLLANFRARFDAYPPSLRVLARWADMDPETRRLVCHWHLQLADPLYRAFSGVYLVERREGGRAELSRELVVAWVGKNGLAPWTMATRVQFASKLLSAAYAARLVTTNRDPRRLAYPRVGDAALGYLFYLLREVDFAGTLLQNPYLASVGLAGEQLDERLRGLSVLRYRRQADLADFGWRHASLLEWAEAMLPVPGRATVSEAP